MHGRQYMQKFSFQQSPHSTTFRIVYTFQEYVLAFREWLKPGEEHLAHWFDPSSPFDPMTEDI